MPQLNRTWSGTDGAVLCAVDGGGDAARMGADRSGVGGASVRGAGTRPNAGSEDAAGIGIGTLRAGAGRRTPGAVDIMGSHEAEPRARTARSRLTPRAVIDGSPRTSLRGTHDAGTSQAGFRPVGMRPDSPGIGRTPKGRQ